MDIQAAKKRCEAARKAKPQDGVALLWVRRYREDVPALVEALEGAEAHLKTARWALEMDDPRLLKALETIERLIAERDGYKARDRLRGKALEHASRIWHGRIHYPVTADWDWKECPEAECIDARAAIDITPDEAGEKEGSVT